MLSQIIVAGLLIKRRDPIINSALKCSENMKLLLPRQRVLTNA